MQQLKTRTGFTLIELSFAILFISLLSLTVALVIINVSAIYTKGLSIKSINSTGSDLIEEFSNTLGSSPATELKSICSSVFEYKTNASSPYQKCLSDNARLFTFNQYEAEVALVEDGRNLGDLQITGVFCTGKYSYVWNTGYVNNPLYVKNLDQTSGFTSAKLKYQTNVGAVKTIENFRLLRIEDPSRVACGSQLVNYRNSNIGDHQYELPTTTNVTINEITYDLTVDSNGNDYVVASDPTELINDTENALALYNFYVAPPAQDSTTNRLFYSGSFVLATLRGGVDITKTGDFCQVEDNAEDFDYCAINKFNFAAQATGK